MLRSAAGRCRRSTSIVPSGLQSIPLESVTAGEHDLDGEVSRSGGRAHPPPGVSSTLVVPARNRPRRSHAPSFIRLPGTSASTAARSSIRPVAGLRCAKPSRTASTRSPLAAGRATPTCWPTWMAWSAPVAGSKRCTASAIDVDPDEPLAAHVPDRPFADLGVGVERNVDIEHGRATLCRHEMPRSDSQPFTSATSVRLIGTSTAALVRGSNHRAVDHVDLGAPARRDVLHHRSLGVRDGDAELAGVGDALLDVDVVPERARDGDGLPDGGVHERRHLRMREERPARHSRERRRRQRRRADDELLPHLGLDRRRCVRVESGVAQHPGDVLRPVVATPDSGPTAVRRAPGMVDASRSEARSALRGHPDDDPARPRTARPGSRRFRGRSGA